MRKEFQRDEALLRLSRGTRWLAAGALVSAGGLSIVVAESLPGRSSAATTPSQAAPAAASSLSTAGSSASGASESPSQLGDDGGEGDGSSATTPATAPPQTFTAPTAPPQTVYNPPVASSGGS